MKKYISFKSVFFLCLAISLILGLRAIAKSESTKNETVAIIDTLRLEVIVDGQLFEEKMVVTLQVHNINGLSVNWKHVYIKPDHNKKGVLLRAGHFSTTEGSIKDVIVTKDSFSFDIHPSPRETVQIIGTKNTGKSSYDIQGVGLVYLTTLDKLTKVEWRSTDKKFILPYKEVF
jgi:hypothetical protein